MCVMTLSNASTTPSPTNYPGMNDRDPNYFNRFGESAKKQRLDNTKKQYQQSVGMVTASYK